MDYGVLKKRLYDLAHLNKGKKFIIYPMGMQGALAKGILNGQMGIMEAYILDNRLCSQCEWIYPVSILGKLCTKDYLVLVACEHPRYLEEIIESLKQYNIEYCDVCNKLEMTPGGGMVYSKPVCYDRMQAENRIRDCLVSGMPFACGRLGHTESAIAYEYCRMGLGLQNSFSEHWSQYLLATSGFFSSPGKEREDIERYAEMTINAVKDMDIHLLFFATGEAFLLKNYAGGASEFFERCPVHYPWNEEGSTWMDGLSGKKVLVVSPFSRSVQAQYEKRRELFANVNNLPDFELITYQSLETQLGDNKGFADWFEAYRHMEGEILQTEFDVAIIGCGAYGYPLTAAVKRAGKQAIEMCSSTQLMFGVKAKRWEDEQFKNVHKWWNDSWIYPMETPPKNYEKIEGGCYW